MKFFSRLSAELMLALGLLAGAVVTDSLWVRPQEARLNQAMAKKRVADDAVRAATQERVEWDAIQKYVGAGADSTGSWRDRYTSQDPLHLLEELRQEAGLRRLDVQLQERETVAPYLRTEYFMSVYGDFDRQLKFLKALEEASPLASVESFVMDTGDADPKITLKLNVSVLTLTEGTPQ